MNKNMRKMYSQEEVLTMVNDLDLIKQTAVDISDLPSTAEMISPYKEVIQKALKSKCIKLNGLYYMVTRFGGDEWVGGFYSNSFGYAVLHVYVLSGTYYIQFDNQ